MATMGLIFGVILFLRAPFLGPLLKMFLHVDYCNLFHMFVDR